MAGFRTPAAGVEDISAASVQMLGQAVLNVHILCRSSNGSS